MTGSFRYDQIDGYEPAPPDPPVGTWGYDGSEDSGEIIESPADQLFSPPPVEA
jgi:hypothetical protein